MKTGRRSSNLGIARVLIAVVIIVIIVVAGAGVYFATLSPRTSSTASNSTSTTNTSSASNSGSTTSSGSGSTTTSSSSSNAPYNESIVVDETAGEPAGVDVTLSDAPGSEIMYNIAQGLVWYQGNSTTVISGVLATNWTVSADGLNYVFSLRQGVKFSNGDPFSAYDVWFNMYRLSLNNGFSASLIGPQFIPPGNITLNDLNTFNFTNPTAAQLAVMENSNQSVQVVNKYTVAFHLPSAVPSFLPRLASPAGLLYDSTFVQAHGGVQNNGTVNQFVASHGAPGTGPYNLTSWEHGCCITLTLNPFFWGPRPHISKVTIQYKSDDLTAINDLKSGAVQMLYSIPFNLLSNVQGSSNIILESKGLSFTIGFLGLNVDHYPLNVTDVRLAINYAINKSALIDKVLSGYGSTFQGPVPIGMFAHNDSIQPYGYNVTEAQQLLTAAGFPGGKGIPALNFLYHSDNPFVSQAAQIIQAELSQIGITVNLQGVTFSSWVNVWATVPRTANYPDIMWGEWNPDFAFPDDYAYTFENSASVFDTPNLNNTQMNQLTNQALFTTNRTQLQQLYSQITQLDKNLSANVWLWQIQDTAAGVPAYLSTVQSVYWNPLFQNGFNYSAEYIVGS